MKKVIKVFKKNAKLILVFLIGVSFTGISVLALNKIESKDVFYTHVSSNVKNVQEAVEELYTLKEGNKFLLENGFRYTGANPNNYISFNNELWRIIGILDGKIKIIRNETIGSHSWNSEQKNDWAMSNLYQYLNTTYYDSLNETSKIMVENATWKTGGWSTPNVTTRQMYLYEGSVKGATSSASIITNGYIGLMSASDYGYASSECYNKMKLNDYNNTLCVSTNWLNSKKNEWTITVSSVSERGVFYISNVVSYINDVNVAYEVRPSLYLKSDVYIKEGTGTSSDPYIVTID